MFTIRNRDIRNILLGAVAFTGFFLVGFFFFFGGGAFFLTVGFFATVRFFFAGLVDEVFAAAVAFTAKVVVKLRVRTEREGSEERAIKSRFIVLTNCETLRRDAFTNCVDCPREVLKSGMNIDGC